ncbi:MULTISPECIES: hypothetical protein [Nocardioides]|uniref:Uncharacterized protein n=1 Tax=Nocardioides vastitatis TaxID=2568655 RepID=A0ABW0ZLU0_9ACTN|nr:hypothetical protein [Nocardioides sp.]THJ08458.1 hypothetical protein E7Z54_04535 [Nocardioides sp.]
MRTLQRPLNATLVAIIALCLALTQVPATIRIDSLPLPQVDPLDIATSLLADSATDTAPVVAGKATTEGSVLPRTAKDGIRTSLPGGGEATIDLPATGTAQAVGAGTVVYDGTHPDTKLIVDRVDPNATPGVASSTRTQIAIDGHAAPTRYEFPVDLPKGVRLARQTSGAVYALNAEGKIVGAFGVPWAVDATGAPVPTHFEVTGSTLVQVVDHRYATYPVIADPWWFVPLIVAGRAITHKVAVRAATRAAAQRAAAEAARRAGYTVRQVGSAVKGNFYTAAGHVIRINGAFRRSNGYSTFAAFKRNHPGRSGYEWHHIVEQANVGRFRAWQIHNKQNLVLIRRGIHRACVSAMMSTKLKNMTRAELRSLGLTRVPANRNLTMRQDLAGYSLANMHLAGLRLLAFCGVKIAGLP